MTDGEMPAWAEALSALSHNAAAPLPADVRGEVDVSNEVGFFQADHMQVLEVARVRGGRQRRAQRSDLRRRDGLDEEDIVSELHQTQQILQHGPSRAALMRDGGNHAADENRES